MIKPITKEHTIFKAMVWVSVVIMLIQMPFSSLAICFGEEGHVLLEPVVNGKCCSVIAKHAVNLIDLKDNHTEPSSHCGDCVDVVLSIEELMKHNQIRLVSHDKNNVFKFSPIHFQRTYRYHIEYNETTILKDINNPLPKTNSIILTTVLRI